MCGARICPCPPSQEEQKQVRCGCGWRRGRKCGRPPHTFCKLLPTVVEPASVKPAVSSELTLLSLLRHTSSSLLTPPPLQFGPLSNKPLPLTPSSQERQGRNSGLTQGGIPGCRLGEGRGNEHKMLHAKIRLHTQPVYMWSGISIFPQIRPSVFQYAKTPKHITFQKSMPMLST